MVKLGFRKIGAVTLIVSAGLSLAGCQTTPAPAVEDVLKSVQLSAPPRDPFQEFHIVPKKLADIDHINDHGRYPKKTLRQWVDDSKDQYSHLKEKRDMHSGRRYAEIMYQRGLPRHAATFLAETLHWENQAWKSAIAGSHAFVATFYASYGELSKAKAHIGQTGRLLRPHSKLSCDLRNRYWYHRANAYVALAGHENQDAAAYAELARNVMDRMKDITDTQCSSRRRDAWRLPELDVISAKAWLNSGDLSKAEIYAHRAFQPGGDGYREQALHILGQIKQRQNKHQEAVTYFLLAKKEIYQRVVSLSAPQRALVNFDLIRSLLELNQHEDAFKVYEKTRKNLKFDTDIWDNLFATSLDGAILSYAMGEKREALAILDRAMPRLKDQFGSSHYKFKEARVLKSLYAGGLSIAQLTGQVEELVQSWNALSATQSTVTQDGAFSLRAIVKEYLGQVFAANTDPAIWKRTFEIAENVRTGTVNRSLQQSALRSLAATPEVSQLLREQQDVQKKLQTLRQNIRVKNTTYRYHPDTLSELYASEEVLEELLADLTSQVRAAIPRYDEIVSANSLTFDGVVKQLQPGEFILSTFTGVGETYVWLVEDDGSVGAHRVKKSHSDWLADAKMLHDNMQISGDDLSNLMDFPTQKAFELYDHLLQPHQVRLKGKDHLIFVSDNALSTIPMGMLLTRKARVDRQGGQMFDGFKKLPWLIRDYAISVAPSVGSLVVLRDTQKAKEVQLAFLGVGDPIFDPSEARREARANTRGTLPKLRAVSQTRSLVSAQLRHLPRLYDTADEINAIAQIVNADVERDLLIGVDANEGKIRDMNAAKKLRQYRVISFATHGLIPGDLDGLDSPAIALSAPLAKEKQDWDDGLLTSHEIMELDLNADWVILSACNTAASDLSSTEAFSGLGKAFFYAGARSMLLSSWPVFSDSTRVLMEKTFLFEPASKSRAEALRQAVLYTMDEGAFYDQFSYAHPLFWAPFSLVGDGG